MDLILYADLTWPEVAGLPRHVPVLVPLGRDEYDYPAIARHLSAQSRAGGAQSQVVEGWHQGDKAEELVVLPPVPYGFRRADGDPSGQLQVRSGLLRRVLLGVQRELKAQGFEHVIFVNGHGMQGLRANGLQVLDYPYRRRAGFDFPPDLSNRVVVISTGHTEQHGYHLPLSTDSLIVEAIARELSARVPMDVYCLPVWPYGVSTHTRQFPGTLNLGGRVFEDFFLAVVDSLVRLGAEMIYFSNGHGGNHSFLVNVVKYAGEHHPGVFVATEWLHTTGPALERYRQSRRGGMGHGGELETSYILHLRPDLVCMEQATVETDFISTPNYYMDWVEGGRLIANPPWSDDTASGIYGDATLGAADKGRVWLASAIDEKLQVLREIREQYMQRQAKRAMSRGPGC